MGKCNVIRFVVVTAETDSYYRGGRGGFGELLLLVLMFLVITVEFHLLSGTAVI